MLTARLHAPPTASTVNHGVGSEAESLQRCEGPRPKQQRPRRQFRYGAEEEKIIGALWSVIKCIHPQLNAEVNCHRRRCCCCCFERRKPRLQQLGVFRNMTRFLACAVSLSLLPNSQLPVPPNFKLSPLPSPISPSPPPPTTSSPHKSSI
ncbi:hypothetical protein E2C01_045180 [Portunus trituberculatus]|uniref:Uncharacterized protein n=1 Tax=Portunus trituberculatus TaxID=210409 RepID=A0A5B7G142_PORTR|nr:hypothetical protein [Portunus trituberculatus]